MAAVTSARAGGSPPATALKNTAGRIAYQAFRDRLPAEKGQRQHSRRRCSGWLQLQVGVSNRLQVKKKREFSDFLPPAVPLCLRRWG